jgi:S-adenosylmethionine-diacylgycerolhomoserine-N-methlytransferase
MKMNHVHMDAHLLPVLEASCRTETKEIHRAYGGMWQYLVFVGVKPAA